MVSTRKVSFQIKALPDSGATRTILSLDLCKKFNIKVTPSRDRLFAADDTPLACEGTCNLKIENMRFTALASSSIKSDLILSWVDLIALGVLPADFPSLPKKETMAAVTCSGKSDLKSLVQNLANRYPDIAVSYTHLTLPTTPYV